MSATAAIIENSAFAYCLYLESIDMTNALSLKTIGEDAFDSCIRLNNVTIPVSVEVIGESAFTFCDNLTNLIIEDTTSIWNYTYNETIYTINAADLPQLVKHYGYEFVKVV